MCSQVICIYIYNVFVLCFFIRFNGVNIVCTCTHVCIYIYINMCVCACYGGQFVRLCVCVFCRANYTTDCLTLWDGIANKSGVVCQSQSQRLVVQMIINIALQLTTLSSLWWRTTSGDADSFKSNYYCISTLHHTSYIIHHASYIIHHTSYIIHHTPYIIHHTSYIMHHTSCIIHHTSHIIHRTSYIIHHTPYIIHHTSYIIHHTSYITHHPCSSVVIIVFCFVFCWLLCIVFKTWLRWHARFKLQQFVHAVQIRHRNNVFCEWRNVTLACVHR